MNQHTSSPLAQGLPLHRHMNGSIQSAGPRTRPSNLSGMTDGEPFSNTLFKSQIPIRAERPLPQPSALQAMQTSASQQFIETVFEVYEDGLQTDLRDLRAMCSRLILQEREEKEKWHGLYLKMMRERDTARQRVSALISERETHLSSSPIALTSDEENLTSNASKGARDEGSSAAQESPQELPSSSRSSPVESHPIRSFLSSPIPPPPDSRSASSYSSPTAINSSFLPSTASPQPPIVSPTFATPYSSPTTPLNILTFNPTRSPNDETSFDIFGVIDIPEIQPTRSRKSYDLSDKTTVLTVQDGKCKDSSCPSRDEKDKNDAKNAAVSPTSATPCSSPTTPLNILTFNPTRSPNDETYFDVFGVIDIPAIRPMRRRKSYDLPDKTSVQTAEDGETKDSSWPSRNEKDKNDTEAEAPPPFLIVYTDIMYIPMKGHLSCRTCLLDKTINPSSSRTPKTFPTNVYWDELRDHCVNEHPTAVADVARLCPNDLNDLRRRLYGDI